jgi:hypothetical protein
MSRNFTREKTVEPDRAERVADQRLQRIHCDLLERATGGRLTFVGDRIVRTTGNRNGDGDDAND